MTGSVSMLTRKSSMVWLERSTAVILALMSAWMLYLWLDVSRGNPVVPVELLEAVATTPKVEQGGEVEIRFTFLKHRSDCNNGRITRYVWNADGDWINVTDHEEAKQASASPNPQPIKIRVPLANARTGAAVPAGIWSLNTIVSYECPFNGEMIVLDDVIDSSPFEIVARGRG